MADAKGIANQNLSKISKRLRRRIVIREFGRIMGIKKKHAPLLKTALSEGYSGPDLSKSLQDNIALLEKRFLNSSDFIKREFIIALGNKRAALFYIDGLVNQKIINSSILEPLMIEAAKLGLNDGSKEISSLEGISSRILTPSEIIVEAKLSTVIEKVLAGDTVLLIDGESSAIASNTKGWEKRSISEPLTESVIRGPRQGFTESIRTNTSMLRRIIRNSSLKFDSMVIGKRSATSVCLAYIDGLANPDLVSMAKERLMQIDVADVITSGFIDEMLEEGPATVFETIAYSERPDIVASKILEGRVAVIVDGTPFVLTMPMLFIENFISSEDYTSRVGIATFLRVLRIMCFFISLCAPALFIALSNFHQELIPTQLLFTMAASSEGLPFSSSMEVAIMLIAYEILQEAGIRLPKPVGQTISLVGALVMGQAAVEAGIVGAPVMIIVSITAVSSFVTPSLSGPSSLLRWLLLILASMFGGIGISVGLFCIYLHLLSLTSFGIPIMAPFAPLHFDDLKDTIVRAPARDMLTRPSSIKPLDLVKQKNTKRKGEN